jgi:CheY-like chemotaxis protein
MATRKKSGGELKVILLVDDDDPTNFHNQLVIRDSGILVPIQTAESALEALDYLKQREIPSSGICEGLILLDINMPGLDGWDFLDEFRSLADAKKNAFEIAILTTSINPEDEQKAREQYGIDAYFRKPLTGDIIKVLVKKHWGTLGA